MAWTRFGEARTARRTSIVDGFDFPTSVRQRFGHRHEGFSREDVHMVEAATRQWFRLVARDPKATLTMPSVLVDDMWRELALHTREYGDFCEQAFGRFLRHEPEPGTDAADRPDRLLATLERARRDEGVEATALPLLFRVDQALRIPGGRRYLADCGGRGQCYGASGMVCIQHVRGLGKPLIGTRSRYAQPGQMHEHIRHGDGGFDGGGGW